MASLLPDVAADETVVRVNEAQKGGNQLVSVLYGRNERTVYLIRNRTLLARTLSGYALCAAGRVRTVSPFAR